MLEIAFKNGDYRLYEDDDYTDYRYLGEIFVVLKDCRWIGIYSMSEIRAVEYRGWIIWTQ